MTFHRCTLIAIGLSVLPVVAAADVIVDQPLMFEPQLGGTQAIASNIFQLVPQSSFLGLDDFTTTAPYRLTNLTAFAINDGSGPNVNVQASIYTALPGPGSPAIVAATTFGTQDPVTRNLMFDFGGQLLPAGSYYLTAFVVRQDLRTHGVWFWGTTPVVHGTEAYVWPIGAFTPPVTEQAFINNAVGGTGQPPLDLAFKLEGNPLASPVPEPATASLIALGLAALGGNKRQRTGKNRKLTP